MLEIAYSWTPRDQVDGDPFTISSYGTRMLSMTVLHHHQSKEKVIIFDHLSFFYSKFPSSNPISSFITLISSFFYIYYYYLITTNYPVNNQVVFKVDSFAFLPELFFFL